MADTTHYAAAVRFELLGLPGSGKTTLLHDLSGAIRTETLEESRPINRIRSVVERVLLAVRNPIWALHIYGAALGARRGRVRALRNALSLQRRVAALCVLPRDTSCLIDEGVIHGLFVLLDGSSPNAMSWFFARTIIDRLARKHDIVWIYVDVEIEECIRRFRTRFHPMSRFNAETPAERQNAFRNSRTYDALHALITERWPERIRVVSDLDSLSNVIRQPAES